MPAPLAPAPLIDWLQHAVPAARAAEPGRALGPMLTALIRQAILDGVLPPAQRLPSTRALAAALGLARNTVVPIYDQLRAEGVVVSGIGSGTYVCRLGPDAAPAASGTPAPRGDVAPVAPPPTLSRRGQRYRGHALHAFWTRQPFCPGQFDFSLFPQRTWNRLQHRHLRRADPMHLESGEPGGALALRRAIADHVRATRGVRCEPSQVIITDGTGESIDLVARLLCDPGDTVLVEDPGYWVATQVLADHGLRLRPEPVDAQGLPVPRTGRGARAPRLAYLTPSNQFPTGAVMPLQRRLEWLQYAATHGTVLLEDDYDSEYRYEGTPFPSLQGQDRASRVIYLGTFSKTVYPGIRVAFLVVPTALQQVFADASADYYRDGDQALQQVLADFLREGHYAAHVRNLRREYGVRREALVRALHDALPRQFADGSVTIASGARGVHLTLSLPARVDDRALSRRAIAAGVTAIPLSVYAQRVDWKGLVLSFAAVPPAQVPALVRQLAPLVHAACAPA